MKKNNNILGVLVVLLSIVVLGLTGFIVYDKVLNKDANEENNTQQTTNNSEIDSALLNSLYDTLGIGWKSDYDEIYNDGDCLNYFLSNNNYKENPNTYGSNAQRIFALYIKHIGASTYSSRNNSDKCGEECQRQTFCADCGTTLKTSADRVIKLYGLEDYKLDELAGFDTDYAYVTGTPMGTCHYLVKHDLNSKYIDGDSVEIDDKQIITDYVYYEPEKINSTKNQNVTYTFKKDSNGDYYLNQLAVK